MSKNTEKYPIDVVVPWVDGSDVEWQKEKQRYLGEAHSKESASVGKYRNWDNFHLQIRSILVNMPWVNKVYIVTNGQIPKWYKKNDKVVIIRHDQFVPKKYLPVFGINPIEVNLHKIPGLSEHFVYLNDDIFVINKTKKTDFFKGGLPCDNAILNVSCVTEKNMIYQIANNNTSVINSHLDMKNCMNNNKKRWFSRKNGIKNNIQNLILSSCPRFPGFKHQHLSVSYVKKTYEEVWTKTPETLLETCGHRFRDKNDINQYLFKDWQIASGKFIPTSYKRRGIIIDFLRGSESEEIDKAISEIRGKKLMLCINDCDSIKNFNTVKNTINAELLKKFPNKSIAEQ